MAFHYSPKIVTDGLVLYLDAANTKSYVPSSTPWNDISRGGNNGTLINGPTFNSANGGSIVFDGVDDYVNIPNSNLLNPTEQITISCYVKLTNLRNSIYESLVVKTSIGGSFGTAQYGLVGWRGGLSAAGIFFRLGLSSGISTVSSNVNNTEILNRWVYVTATYNGSSMRIYYNSVLQNSLSTTGTINTITDDLFVGKNGINNDNYTSSNIANVKVYNKALSPTEVLQNYNATKSRFGLL
jgi:hypothetical protein